MAVDIFLKMDPIKGESYDDKHKDEIDVLAWSWGMSNAGTHGIGGGGGAGKVNMQDLTFTKYVDAASTSLMLACCNGQHFAKANLVVRKAGETPLEYLKIEMKDVLVSGVSTGGAGREDRFTENVTLNFAAVKVEYTPQEKDGSKGKGKDMGWDIKANKKA